MSNIGFYRCETCGNVLALLKGERLTRACCSKTLTKLESNVSDGATELHIPIINKGNGVIRVTVGSVLHPMLPEHHIDWIALDTGEKTEIVYLHAGMEPRAEFAEVNEGVIYEYCNIHGLWKADL